jgi:uncharacterized protein (DUF433 family)
MRNEQDEQTTIIRTKRGLTLSGTRITLYDILGYLHAGWSPERTRDILRLADEQLRVSLEYIAAHRDAVEQEYQQVLSDAAAARRFWEERNRDRLAQIAAMPPKPGTEALQAKRAEDETTRSVNP